MADYIEREAADKALTLSAANDKDKNRRIWAKAICILHDIPAADVMPVAHGRWVAIGADKRGRGGIFRCSSCNKTCPFICSYCPNCGAKMDGGAV